ncbi:MAG TPA: glycosyltransferase [Candidatus Hydrogenedentes bacterium]|nr:glycosyltransferase [Candidatus Hydrogenedentota bacterium]HOL75409.1 glycosyltransferase [Candidatus Hydrogenedentota bacterium]HPO84918.1 glycosyltransferase [Candidatus Hydrogenedentota bacterium]
MSRVCVLSQRSFRRELSRCCVYEFEDLIKELDSADIVVPETTPHRHGVTLFSRVFHHVSRKMHITMTPTPIVTAQKLTSSYDLLFVMVQDPTDLEFLRYIPNWRDKCRTAICWVEELWKSSLKWHKFCGPLKWFDHVVLNCSQTVEPLKHLLGVTCWYLPPAVDALSFCPYPNSPQRCIDVYYMGRRSSIAHDVLYEAALKGEIFYLFDTVKPEAAYDYRQHRFLLAEWIKRTRYFIANRAKIDSPEQTENQHEVGFRFFEGAAGGAILVGDPPEIPEFSKLFNWPDAFFPVPYDSKEILNTLKSLDCQPERIAEARRNNVVNSLLRHDWVYRWNEILRLANLEPLPSNLERQNQLRRIAETVVAQEE